MPGEGRRYLADRNDEDAVVRATKRDRRVREPRAKPRRDDDDRRAPRETSAFAEEDRLGRAHSVGTQARQDLEAAGERPGSASERRSRPFVREIVDAVRHEPDLASRRRGEAYELSRRRDNELGGLGIGLDPILLVRRDVDEEDRVEARRRFVNLCLQLAKASRGLPMDLLARVAAPVRPDSAKAKGIGHQSAARRRLGEGPQRGKRAIADGEWRGVRRDLGSERYGPFALSEAEPVAGTQAQGPDRIGAAGRDADGQAHEDAFPPAHWKPKVDPATWTPGRRPRRLDPFGEEEARVQPRQRQWLAVHDLDGRDRKLAGDDPIRGERDTRVHRRQREATGDLDDEPRDQSANGKHDDRRRTADGRSSQEEQHDLPREVPGPQVERMSLHRVQPAVAATSSAGTGVRARTSAMIAVVVRPRIWASALRKSR